MAKKFTTGGRRPARRISTPSAAGGVPAEAENASSSGTATRVKRAVAVPDDVFVRLESVTEKRALPKSEYVAAALRYFLDNGLDPLQAQATDGTLLRIQLSERLGASTHQLLKRDDENTNRLITLLRGVERQLYTYQQQSNLAILDYLAKIEAGNLAYLIGLETQVLAPMVELLLRGNIDAHMARMTSSILLHVGQRGEKPEEMTDKHRKYDENRERKLVDEMRLLLQKYRVVKPESTPKPKLPVPPGVPLKSATSEPDYY